MTTLTTLPSWCADTLTTFKAEHGRKWREVLEDLWYSGADAYARDKARNAIGATLRQVRNHPQRDEILSLVK